MGNYPTTKVLRIWSAQGMYVWSNTIGYTFSLMCLRNTLYLLDGTSFDTS